MKNLKKIFAVLFLVSLALTSFAQLRVKTTAPLPQGQFLDFGVSPKDTLNVSDTIAYVIPIEHTNQVNFYQTFRWVKIGAGTATMDIQYFQSNDGTNWFTVKKGVLQTAYSKTFTLSSSQYNEVDFALDTARVSARYLKVQFKTSATSSVSGAVSSRLKSYFN